MIVTIQNDDKSLTAILKCKYADILSTDYALTQGSVLLELYPVKEYEKQIQLIKQIGE